MTPSNARSLSLSHSGMDFESPENEHDLAQVVGPVPQLVVTPGS